MSPWVWVVVLACLIAVTVGLVGVLLAIRRVALRAESLLGTLEQEVHPVTTDARTLLSDVSALTREANREMERVGAVTERAHDVADGVSRIVNAVSGIARTGQLVSLAVGVRKGLDVFVQRLRKGQGDDHG
jgi:uncharacterized protein YoxC